MESVIAVDRVWLTEGGRRVNYEYHATGRAAKYFSGRPLFYAVYDAQLDEVPEAILLIPLVANLAPISWLAGVPLVVPVLDSEFIASVEKIKSIFMTDYPHVSSTDSPLRVASQVISARSGTTSAMLFSGGVDAYATFFRHRGEMLDLVSIHGADIPLDNDTQWQSLVERNAGEPILAPHRKRYIKANLRDFYTYHVANLIPSKAWWGVVQHGLALNCLVAPLAFVAGYRTLYIASSYTDAIEIKWGSTPDIDNQIAWSGTSVNHDGFELKRIDKIGLIASEVEAMDSDKVLDLRVCYSELNTGLNCSNCEKCFRTMLGIALYNGDPSHFGFEINESTSSRILALVRGGFKSAGSRYFWSELSDRMRLVHKNEVHLLGTESEYAEIVHALGKELERPIHSREPSIVKLALIQTFPALFSMYMKVRRRFS